jgi:predicted SnoaL-like aldol condensation-catalyzing enzyme
MTPLAKLSIWYATLSVDTLQDIERLYAPDASFKDPFNEVVGIAAIKKIFSHMFETTEQPQFVILESIQQGNQAFLTWHFIFGLNEKKYTVKGGTHLRFDDAGLVTMHRDYWDAAEELWQKLPLIGGIVRWLRGKFRAV